MPPTLADRVWHILEAINDIERALASTTYEQFVRDRMLRAAVERLLEIVSEASRHVPAEVKAAETSIPWQKVLDFGNQLRHAYHQIDAEIIWKIVKNDLPPMKAFAERVMREEK